MESCLDIRFLEEWFTRVQQGKHYTCFNRSAGVMNIPKAGPLNCFSPYNCKLEIIIAFFDVAYTSVYTIPVPFLSETKSCKSALD